MFRDSGLTFQMGVKQETEGVCIVLEFCDKFLTKPFIIIFNFFFRTFYGGFPS